MRIHHIAIWTQNLEKMREFYITYFEGVSNDKYVNQTKGFESYFIRFDNDLSIELMSRIDITNRIDSELLGLCHLAFALDSKQQVLDMTERFRADGQIIVGEPRLSGDNYFESVVLDVDGNKIELVYQNV